MEEKHVEVLADAIITKMKESHHVFWVDPEVHSEQHKFIAMLIKEREEKLQRRRRIEEKIAGSVILSFLLFVVGLIGAGFIEWLKGKMRNGQS